MGKNTATVSEFLKVLKQETKPTKLGLVGFCWGGKVATMVARQSDLIDAVGSCHPAYDFGPLAFNDARLINA